MTFDLVDDICLGIQGGSRIEPPFLVADALGPLLELRQSALLGDQISNEAWLDVGQFSDLLQHANSSVWYSSDARQGVASVSALNSEMTVWTEFVVRGKRAAKQAGFSDDYGGKLLAAIGEIFGNVVDHSSLIESGFVAFHSAAGQFEFVVADSGIGVLNSLRGNPKYGALSDSGTALELALAEGVSRYAQSDHGFGFRLCGAGEHLKTFSIPVRRSRADNRAGRPRRYSIAYCSGR